MVKKTKKQFYVFECSADGVNAEFYINDIPIIRRGEEFGKKYGGPCNQYLIDGVNELSAILVPGEIPSESLSSKTGRTRIKLKEKASVKAELSVYPFGAVMGGPAKKVLMSVDFQLEPDQWMVFQKVISARTDLGKLFGEWEWQKAPRIELTPDTLKEIQKFIKDLHMSLAAGDPELFLELGEPRLKDIEKAFDLIPGEKADLIRTVTLDDAEQDWWGVEDLNPDDYDLRLCAHDRMVEIINKKWKPILQEHPDPEGGVGTYSMTISKLNGKWKIVR
jgi:hypothetical protein